MATIEDVDYLWENSERDTHLIYLDSEMRDRRRFPNPNHYCVDFVTPPRFVYGYTMLDATLPTTMFNVEKHNNKLVVGTVDGPSPLWRMTTFDAAAFMRDYGVGVPELVQRFLDPSPGSYGLAPVDKLQLYGIDHVERPDDQFVQEIMVSQTHLAYASPDPLLEADPDARWDVIKDSGGARTLCVDRADAVLEDRSRFVIGPPPPDPPPGAVATVTFFQRRFVTELGMSTLVQTKAYDVMITVINIFLNPQNYDNQQLQQNLNNALNAFQLGCAHTSAIPEQANRFTFSSQMPFFINMHESTCRVVLGFDELTTPVGVAKHYAALPNVLNPFDRMFMSFYNTTNQRQEVVTPGLLNLIGVRYIVLRCPEIESFADGGRGIMARSPGMGIFKLVSGANGISNLRFDYINLVTKPFHPIGKLPRITVMFEQPSGELYDMKGVNHHIIIALKILVPSISKDAASTLHRYGIKSLNDEYHPDVLQFITKERTIDSEDEPDPTEKEEPHELVSSGRGLIRSLLDLYMAKH